MRRKLFSRFKQIPAKTINLNETFLPFFFFNKNNQNAPWIFLGLTYFVSEFSSEKTKSLKIIQIFTSKGPQFK